MRAFAYERPTRLDDAIALLTGHGPDARLLAGGTDLIIRLRDGTLQPKVVVDVKRVAGLDGQIREADGVLRIGALTTMTGIADDSRLRRDFAALTEAALVVGSVQIRNRATLAGNICNASPAADTLPALLVYGASAEVTGPRGTRTVALDEVLVRSGVTTLERGELVSAIELPMPSRPHGAAHLRRTRRRGHDLASVTLACRIDADGVTRIAYGSLGPRPILVVDETGVLSDAETSEPDRLRRLDELFADASPSPRSMRASPDDRLAMLRVLGLRGVAVANVRLRATA
jgi:carbon-monoxide dehydrogenase medium subunit